MKLKPFKFGPFFIFGSLKKLLRLVEIIFSKILINSLIEPQKHERYQDILHRIITKVENFQQK